VRDHREELEDWAETFLMVPDYIHWFLTNKECNEVTNASTTQLLDPRTRSWSPKMIELCGLAISPVFGRKLDVQKSSLFPSMMGAGDFLGELTPDIARMTNLTGVHVVLPATHDTASAVAAVPAEMGENWAYVSSGTWSLVGVELPEPIINDAAREGGFTNECGIKGTIRFLKNMTGLWILQECRRVWGDPDYKDLYGAAAGVENAPTFDPDDPRFLPTGNDMPERVMRAIGVEGEAPSEPNAHQSYLTRSIFNSLAAKTARVLDEIERIAGRKIERVHIVGGGSQIELLNQLIADASGREVVAGPTEATLIGNILVQAEACGSIDQGSIREVVRRSFETKGFMPQASRLEAAD
jgi:rhamnulokinase